MVRAFSGRLACVRAMLFVALCSGTADTAFSQDLAKPGVSLTVYNQNFAVVKDRRRLDLPKLGTVRFPNVAASIVPETVTFAADEANPATVLEQNYEFDLVNADKLLQSYIDRPITLVDKQGAQIEGRLLSSDGAQIVLSGNNGLDLLPRRNLRDIRFSKLPGGLLTKPTLVWKVKSARAGERLVRVAYRANNMTWNVNYRAVAAADETAMDLAGWVTVTNNSGASFADARLKLMAGDVNVESQYKGGVRRFSRLRREGKKVLQGKSFSEYHLYTLSQPTTLRNAQTKQIELIKLSGIPVTKEFLYRPNFGNRVGVQMKFRNDKETHEGLGIPLPKGPFRMYQRDADGEPEFVGADSIDHTPKNEGLSVRIGWAFDVAVQRLHTATQRKANEKWELQQWQLRFRNHREKPITIRVLEPLAARPNWELPRINHEYTKKDFRTIEMNVDVPADGETVVEYVVRYTW